VTVFTKLASQLSIDALAGLAIIPLIFVIQTAVSWLVSVLVSRVFRFHKRAANFVTAMGVFGNSNSLPISLVIAFSQTLDGLHWDRIPGDNDDDVAARGILYLLLFQQLGQLVRWSWGYHVLLAPKPKVEETEDPVFGEGLEYRNDDDLESGAYADASQPPTLTHSTASDDSDSETSEPLDRTESTEDFCHYWPAGPTPVASGSQASPEDSGDEDSLDPDAKNSDRPLLPNRHSHRGSVREIVFFPQIRSGRARSSRTLIKTVKSRLQKKVAAVKSSISQRLRKVFNCLPSPLQSVLKGLWSGITKVYVFLEKFMNPPLWAMMIAVIVASVPKLHDIFFEEDSFVYNSVTRAVSSSGSVAVPLILVVLGANLARNTQQHENHDHDEEKIGTKLLIASLVSRMLLPTIIMAPILALVAKYIPVSILDDPIFVIVCFLLTGAPSALQLAQICQLNGVYEGVMAKILFQSYVIW
jgi:predicted permease